MLKNAQKNGYAVGYFEAWDTYSFEAVLEAAEEENSPVVLGFGGMTMHQDWLKRYGIAPLGHYGIKIIESSKIPAAFILNEVPKIEHIKSGIGTGFNTVMLDSSYLAFKQNVTITSKVVKLVKPYNIEVQAELGRLPTFGETSDGGLTDPDQAEEFVKKTGVDFLAVSIGNVHLQTNGSFNVDTLRLEKIREKVPVPLVLHGGSGFPNNVVDNVIKAGISLFHYGTAMKKAFLEETVKHLKKIPNKIDYQAFVGCRKATDILMPAKKAIKNIVKRQIKLYGSSNKAKLFKKG